ncbi:MAG: glycosyl transferase family 28 [Chitinophagaceae bacterium]|nr:glycosyl transferase family 28 [Chitinophagaceae bacterium]
MTRIKAENRWLKLFLEENNVCALISDNRYGLSHPGVYSIFITHQLGIKTGIGRLFDKICQSILYKYINRFSECWVPDFSNSISLAGELSHPQKFPSTAVHYVGALSRFESCDQQNDFLYDVVIILSGPEPQRTILEKMILEQLPALQMKTAFVRGLPNETGEITSVNGEFYNHLDTGKLNRLLCASRMIICRSGYSTVMDMIKLRKKMIVIPTPGQPEQEYLGKYLCAQQLAINIPQHQFELKRALDAAEKFAYRHINYDMNSYKDVVRNFVAKISS